MSAYPTKRDEFIAQIALLLGGEMVDIELDPVHYHAALSIALDKLRQRSDGALEEQDIFLALQPGVEQYTLPQEVQEVRRLYRRGVGNYTNGGIDFNPADGAFYNMYLLQGGAGGLATWDFYNQYLETVDRVFASQYNFVWYNSTKTLRLIKKPQAVEEVIVRVWTTKSEEAVLYDPYAGPWVRSYALAITKQMLGQARNKYPSGFPGPNGAVTLNGDVLLQESAAEIEKLDEELYNIVAAGDGYSFIIG